MKKLTITYDVNLVASCGLYCGSCKKYMNKKCGGCIKNEKASWCKIRTCTIEQEITNCSECKLTSIQSCNKLNNTIGKVFKFIFKTDRLASLEYITQHGVELYVEKMCSLNQMAIKKNQKV